MTVEVNQLRLEIKDNGQGIPPKTLKHSAQGIADSGVGIAGMRERMRELGGSVRIKSDKNGTFLRIVIPGRGGSPSGITSQTKAFPQPDCATVSLRTVVEKRQCLIPML